MIRKVTTDKVALRLIVVDILRLIIVLNPGLLADTGLFSSVVFDGKLIDGRINVLHTNCTIEAAVCCRVPFFISIIISVGVDSI